MKTIDLEGADLDAAVAMADGWIVKRMMSTPPNVRFIITRPDWSEHARFISEVIDATVTGYHPSRVWADGGPVIEKWKVANDGDLRATMRTFVINRLGEEIELPAMELTVPQIICGGVRESPYYADDELRGRAWAGRD